MSRINVRPILASFISFDHGGDEFGKLFRGRKLFGDEQQHQIELGL